uniref:Ymf64 n=1 Tax=Tetrahymena rostrata TaxID=5909 RepID=A0A6G5NK87_TETRO|nr:Ymf64 [Tetrahymena rostrata]QBI37929.1 Ymf64 [Tetrahymena rostrata]URP31119.1 Ymf64 [Tetrahymena rostrata]
MKKLNFIKKINLLKKIDNINSINFSNEKFYSNYFNTIKIKEFYNYNHNLFKMIIYKNSNNIIFTSNKYLLKYYFDIRFLNFINTVLLIDNHTLYLYRNFMNNKIHTSYDLTLIHTLALSNIIKKGQMTRKNINSVLNIRDQFKATNEKILNKTTIVDITIKKLIESKLKHKVSINFDQYSIKFFKKKNLYAKILRRKMRRMRRMLRWAKLSLRNFLRISLVFLCTKDIDIFAKVLLRIMNSMHYKNHRRFLYYLKLFISKSLNYYYDVLKFEGFFFYLSGKISGGGNSKKKRYAIRCGKYSLTNKMLKLKFKKGLIHTKTGVLGYRFMISYN